MTTTAAPDATAAPQTAALIASEPIERRLAYVQDRESAALGLRPAVCPVTHRHRWGNTIVGYRVEHGGRVLDVDADCVRFPAHPLEDLQIPEPPAQRNAA